MIPDSFYEEEVRNGERITKETKKLWGSQLEILEYFISFCQKYRLKYFVDSGTLLGAVRHQGYIPWDDDIDVVMFREDYNRFQRMAMRLFKPPFFCQTIYNDPLRMIPHIQIRMDDTFYPDGVDMEYHHGVFIDVFPLDGIPNEKEQERQHTTKLQLYWLAVQKCTFPEADVSMYGKGAVDFCERCKDIPAAEMYKQFELLSAQYSVPETKMWDCVWFRMLGKTYGVPRQAYEESVELSYEYMTVLAPKNYDVVLQAHYGADYMVPKKLATLHGTV